MCLSTQALLLFISLLPKEIVNPSSDQIVIAAETGNVTWESFDGEWCTVAPLTSASIEKATE